MTNTKTIYRILKAIDIAYENNDFNAEETFNLEKFKISKRRLNLMLENLSKDGFIMGITTSRDMRGNLSMILDTPRLTSDGLLFLENNSYMKQAEEAIREAKGWIPGDLIPIAIQGAISLVKSKL